MSSMAADSVTDNAVSRVAKNMRAMRTRRRRGLHVAIIRLTQDQVDWLKERGYLPEPQRKAELSEAIETFHMDFMV
jgi:hypothetical protein